MKYDKSIINRMKRIEGQLRGILRMMEEGKDCKDVVYQLSAVTRALEKATAVIVSKNLEHCIRENVNSGKNSDELIQQAVQLLIKSK